MRTRDYPRVEEYETKQVNLQKGVIYSLVRNMIRLIDGIMYHLKNIRSTSYHIKPVFSIFYFLPI